MPSQEPKSASAPTGYQSNPFQLLRPSWEGFKPNAGPYIGLIAIMLGFGVIAALVVVGLGFASRDIVTTVIAALAAVAALILLSAVFLGPATVRLQLAMARGQKLGFKDAFKGESGVGWRLLGVGVLTFLALIGGAILLIIPGLIFATWFSFAGYVVVAENLGVLAAMRRSKELVKNRFWDAFGTNSLYQSPGIFYLLPGVGWILVIAASFIIAPLPAIRYNQLVELKKTGDGKDIRTSPANFLAVLLAVIAMGANGNDTNLSRYSTPNQLEKNSGPY